MTAIERLRQFVEYLSISKSEFYRKSKLSNGYLDRDSSVQSDKLESISKAYPQLNLDWVLTGRGSMISDSNIIPDENPSWLDLPLLPVSPRAGFLELDDQRNEYDTVRVLCEAGDDYRHCVVAEVWGDSMEPTLPDRCRVVCRPMPPERWPWLSAGVYAISFGSSFVIKRIHQNRMSTEGRMELHSDNPTGGTLEVHTDDIRHMWRVETIVKATVK